VSDDEQRKSKRADAGRSAPHCPRGGAAAAAAAAAARWHDSGARHHCRLL